LVILVRLGNFTKIGIFTQTLEPETLESRSKAQKTRILV